MRTGMKKCRVMRGGDVRCWSPAFRLSSIRGGLVELARVRGMRVWGDGLPLRAVQRAVGRLDCRHGGESIFGRDHERFFAAQMAGEVIKLARKRRELVVSLAEDGPL